MLGVSTSYVGLQLVSLALVAPFTKCEAVVLLLKCYLEPNHRTEYCTGKDSSTADTSKKSANHAGQSPPMLRGLAL